MPGGNRTHNDALGGHGYIHLTTDTYSDISYTHKNEKYLFGCKKDVISSAINQFVYKKRLKQPFYCRFNPNCLDRTTP